MLALLAAVSLQAALTDAMRAVSGAALIADAATGRVLAEYGGEKVRSRRAAPGSTLKPVALAMLIESGAGDGKIACRGRLQIGDRRLDCGHPRVAGVLDGSEALGYSCNEWFAAMGRRLDPSKFALRLRELGFEAETAVTEDQRALQAMGEYGVRITPAELMEAYRRLLRLRGDPRYGAVFRGMEGAVEYGSAQLAAVQGLKVAGKTGTTANASRTDTHAWFAGYAPAGKPEVVVVVFVESGKGGPTAAPIASRVLAAWQGASVVPRRLQPGPHLTVGRRDGAVVQLGMEEYVEAVLAGEAASFPDEALKAMAVAARTYAAANRGRHKADGWDFCDTSHCQNLRFDGAVRAARGRGRGYRGAVAVVRWQAGADVLPSALRRRHGSGRGAVAVAGGAVLEATERHVLRLGWQSAVESGSGAATRGDRGAHRIGPRHAGASRWPDDAGGSSARRVCGW